jgi:hypothetical protein
MMDETAQIAGLGDNCQRIARSDTRHSRQAPAVTMID